jgi:predicted nucleic acid-binding Zn ribbon protein
MSCPHCKTQLAKGAGWCMYCGEDINRSQHRMRYIYYFAAFLVLTALIYFFVLPSFSIG